MSTLPAGSPAHPSAGGPNTAASPTLTSVEAHPDQAARVVRSIHGGGGGGGPKQTLEAQARANTTLPLGDGRSFKHGTPESLESFACAPPWEGYRASGETTL
ncbi:hypothetical protein MAPG_01987 [Magnaporthiopsis poae ATCC 64411]|uniref:Uncharacterized protein n=1 Tax=Magnaporthiopsis poae (strain ATCC 64411 / 73-15) TaxID=644358 RepID=A0A0C4DQ49_MAGP6|nr:hypothetical protein MAPG_01987 [Magnaporthiopsis poae ATCC 64411]